MADFYETGPAAPVVESIRVDKVSPRSRWQGKVRAAAVIVLALIGLIPIYVMGVTAFKTRTDVVAVPPKITFSPTLEGFVFLFTERAVVTSSRMEEVKKAAEAGQLSLFQRIALNSGQQITGTSDYVRRLKNSLIIAGLSTLFSVTLGLFAAYAFSRFEVKGKDDLMFFILSTRMLPAVVVTIPIFLMYRQLGLHDTHLGMILLYTVFNLSLSVWLLKGFIDEIPREYEDAALVDGYTRMQAFFKIVLPQAVTGIAATTVFCLIFAWNEYAFALMLTSDTARTAPPSIATMLGRGGIEWSAIAAGSLGFLIPVVIVAFALRNYLLRGVTFGAIRQ
ncbi:MAG: carbohydrate ABC transporter permease [Caldilineales bacterium]|nr:carbohydrate ABC transporter permease [Caldilineales bacterium]